MGNRRKGRNKIVPEKQWTRYPEKILEQEIPKHRQPCPHLIYAQIDKSFPPITTFQRKKKKEKNEEKETNPRPIQQVERFVEEECIPADAVFAQQTNAHGHDPVSRFNAHPPVIEDLKAKARKLGLWNMFLPKNHFKEGAGFSNLEYGLMAEYLGKSVTASEATNCAAPDTGNMEVFAKYGTEEQKKKWLVPLLNGEIRSAFLMTEPQVASSDATNIELDMKKDGDYYVLNGQVSVTVIPARPCRTNLAV
jgi:alkylation response protein AidB-like acyl-CoA dehydrogenase